MALRYYLGAPGSWDYADATELVETVRFPGPQALDSSADGTDAASGRIDADDAAGALEPRAWWPVWCDEDLCDPPRVWTGLIVNHTYGRQDSFFTGAGRVISLDLKDVNTLLKWEPIRLSQGSKRPAETVAERIAWVLGLLDGLVYDTGYVDVDALSTGMDESDFTKSYPLDVLASIAAMTASDFYVIWDDVAGVPSLVYEHRDETQITSELSISNVASDLPTNINTGVKFPPSEDSQLERIGEEVYSSIDYDWRGPTIHLTDAGTQATFFGDFPHRGFEESSDRVGRQATATQQATTLLANHAEEKDSITTTIWLPPNKVNLVRCGMLMTVRYSHFPGFETDTELKVMRRSVREDKPQTDGRYQVDLRLELGKPGDGVGGGGPQELPHPPPEDTTCTPTNDEIQGHVGGSSAEYYLDGTLTGPAPGPGNSGGNAEDGYYGIGTDPNFPDVSLVGFGFFGADPAHTYERRLSIDYIDGPGATSLWALRIYPSGNPGYDHPTEIKYSTDSTNGTDGSFTTIGFSNSGLGGTSPGSLPASTDGYYLYTFDETVEDVTFLRVSWVIGPGASGAVLDLTFWEAAGLECVASEVSDNPPETAQWVPWAPAASVTPGSTTTAGTTTFPYATGSLHVRVDGVDVDPSHVDQTDPAAGEFELDWVVDTDETVTVYYQGR